MPRMSLALSFATVIVAAGCSAPASGQPTTGASIPAAASPPSSASVPSPSQPSTLLPDGAWQVELSSEELAAAGANPGALPAGVYTWTFEGTHARLGIAHDGKTDFCSAEASPVDGGVLFSYLQNLGCGGWTDTIAWTIERDGLHVALVASTGALEDNAAYLQAKVWHQVAAEPIPSWPVWSARCEPGCQGPMASATFTSSGFLPGLQLTFGTGEWFNSRDDEDEIEFDRNQTAVRLWGNPQPASPAGDPVTGVASTEAGLTKWFVKNPNMVVSSPCQVKLGAGVSATPFSMTVSDSNVNVDPDCPEGTRSCLNVLWINDGHVFAIGYGSAERLYLLSLSNGDVMVVSVDAPDQATLDALQPEIDDLLGTLRLPPAG